MSRQIDRITPSPIGGSRLLSERQTRSAKTLFFLVKTQRSEEREVKQSIKIRHLNDSPYHFLYFCFKFTTECMSYIFTISFCVMRFRGLSRLNFRASGW